MTVFWLSLSVSAAATAGGRLRGHGALGLHRRRPGDLRVAVAGGLGEHAGRKHQERRERSAATRRVKRTLSLPRNRRMNKLVSARACGFGPHRALLRRTPRSYHMRRLPATCVERPEHHNMSRRHRPDRRVSGRPALTRLRARGHKLPPLGARRIGPHMTLPPYLLGWQRVRGGADERNHPDISRRQQAVLRARGSPARRLPRASPSRWPRRPWR